MKTRFSKFKYVFIIFYTIIGALYFPLYLFAWLLRIVSRFFLALSYFGMLDGRKGKDIIKTLFSTYVEKR